MTNTCYKKCVRNGDTDLQNSEISCLDRCSLKYMQVYKKIGDIVQNFQPVAPK